MEFPEGSTPKRRTWFFRRRVSVSSERSRLEHPSSPVRRLAEATADARLRGWGHPAVAPRGRIRESGIGAVAADQAATKDREHVDGYMSRVCPCRASTRMR